MITAHTDSHLVPSPPTSLLGVRHINVARPNRAGETVSWPADVPVRVVRRGPDRYCQI